MQWVVAERTAAPRAHVCACARDQVLASKENIQVGARVASNHTKILRKDSLAVADVVRELAQAA